jgi:succinate dehydrogenase / fumarate reductase iron-sulfur subunit
MKAHFRIRRFNPEQDAKPYWQEFTLDNVIPTDRVLELMHRIKWELDGTLSFRRSCAHGVCGSDAMRINGRNVLACKMLVSNLASEGAEEVKIQVEPILGLPVVKDLIVDMEPFFDHYKAVMPYFVNDAPLPADGRERRQSPEERAIFDDSTKCILCAACTTSCPSFWANGAYVGPAAIVQAHRFIYDTRDQAAEQRLDILAAPDGVWRCRTIYNCTPACPREIEVTRAIGEVKVAIQRGAEKTSQQLVKLHTRE